MSWGYGVGIIGVYSSIILRLEVWAVFFFMM